jgi:glycosyltransferase involved in cell wall biosynthesis
MLTYNREELVGRAIESVLTQTFGDFEFIVVNNGSDDRSGEIANMYADRDRRMRVLHRKRGNIGSGRNTGLALAKGEYVTFVDDDDWCEPDFLEFLFNIAIENAADVAICGATGREFDEKRVMQSEEALIELMRRSRFNMAFPTKLFARKLAEAIHFPENGRYDDISQMHHLIALANRVAYHGLPKYTFYRHIGNNSAWTTDYKLLDSATLNEYLNAYRVRTEWLSAKFPNNIMVWQYFEWSFMISMVEKIARFRLHECYPLKDIMIDTLRENKRYFLESKMILDFEKRWTEEYV